MARHDVAIYAPFSVGFYDATQYRAGGAERQMTLLAHALAGEGWRVAHIVYPTTRRPPRLPIGLTLVERGAHASQGSILRRFLEAGRVWRALWAADAIVTIIPTGNPVLGVAAVLCRARRRLLVFRSASDSDFTFPTLTEWYRRALYKLGIHFTNVIVTLTREQVELARHTFPRQKSVIHIPPAAEQGSEMTVPPADSFIWIGRGASYKEPLRYIRLAKAVPEARFVMVVVPDTSDSFLLEEIETFAADTPNLELKGLLPHDEVMQLVARSVAVVNTSRFEGMPNVFLEAWACGIPVLTLEVDPDGVVLSRQLGVSASGSWDRFVAGARELWTARADREELSLRSRSYVQEFHSLEAVTGQWVDLLSSLLAGG